jgi:hypothetical protein
MVRVQTFRIGKEQELNKAKSTFLFTPPQFTNIKDKYECLNVNCSKNDTKMNYNEFAVKE